LKFLNELAASNDRNFKFTARGHCCGISSLQAVRAEGYAEMVVPVLKGLI
jgi:hypothetical protein